MIDYFWHDQSGLRKPEGVVGSALNGSSAMTWDKLNRWRAGPHIDTVFRIDYLARDAGRMYEEL